MNTIQLRRRALELPCPECGAKSGHRCGTLSHRADIPNYPPARRHWTARKYPHDARVTAAWREHLKAIPESLSATENVVAGWLGIPVLGAED